jgi:hypothetical protein
MCKESIGLVGEKFGGRERGRERGRKRGRERGRERGRFLPTAMVAMPCSSSP